MTRSTRPATVLGVILLVGLMAPVSGNAAENACRAGRNDQVERAAPDALLGRLGRTFGVAPEVLHGSSFVRCARGHLLGCMVGANLNCGRADVTRHSAGGDGFCHDSPGADSIPLAATGHDTIYDWHCDGTRAIAGKIVAPVDSLGFMKPNWRIIR